MPRQTQLAQIVAKTVGFTGTITLDRSKPDGTPRKLMSGAKLAAMGWRPTISLQEGLAAAYRSSLRSKPQTARARLSSSVQHQAIEIEIAGGRRLRFERDTDPATIECLITLLEGVMGRSRLGRPQCP